MIAGTVASSDLALQRLYRWEKTAPDRVVLTQPIGAGATRDFRWADVLGQARRMAAHLQSLGYPAGSRIAIIGKNSAHWLIADFAIWIAGHVSVPIYPTLATATVRQVLEHSGSRLLFIGKLDDWDATKAGIPAGLAVIELPLAPPTGHPIWDSIVAMTEPLAGEPTRAADELATIIYTSGTTGVPKGVMHSFGGFAWAMRCVLERLEIDPATRILSYLPLAHVAERMLVEQGLLASGMHVYFAESLDTFNADLKRARPTAFFSVPRLWVKFQQAVNAKTPPERLATLLKIPVVGGLVARKIRAALGLDACLYAASGAAPLPAEMIRWYASLGLPISEAYGMTENCAVSHAVMPGETRPGTVGKAYDGIQCRIDASSGEVQMKSPALMLGYYREPELTAQAYTADGWLRTGDKGELDLEGNLRITGRVKDLFKTSKGKYVAPAPIEDRLVMHPALEACAVTGANLDKPLGLVLLNAEAAARCSDAARRAAVEAALATHLDSVNAALEAHERLACLVVVTTPWSVENGFVTPTFKIKRSRIDEVYEPMYARWAEARRAVIWERG